MTQENSSKMTQWISALIFV